MSATRKPRSDPMELTDRSMLPTRAGPLLAMLLPWAWEDSKGQDVPEWVRRLSSRAAKIGVRVVYDTHRSYRESLFCLSAADGKPYILCGGAGKETFCCTVLIHELAHAMLHNQRSHPSDKLRGEEAAWQLANRIAQEERLPLMSAARRRGLYSYRRASLLAAVAGSKNQAKASPIPKTSALIRSRRSKAAKVRRVPLPKGKKARRNTKRHVKRATAKAERRAQRTDFG
jgi:hypothetical protein